MDDGGSAATARRMIRLCFHGAESTGKSTLARKLGYPWVPEFGREWCEARGTDLTMDDLFAIAHGQDVAIQAAVQARPPVLILDTDPLMTAAWAQMLFGEIPDRLLSYERADHYLLFAPDVAWDDDGTRCFGTSDQRERFAAVAHDVLTQAGVGFDCIFGNWNEREVLVRAVISRLLV